MKRGPKVNREQATQALGFTAIILGGGWLGMTVWKQVHGTPAEGPVVLASALLFASIILWGRRTTRKGQLPASGDPDTDQEKGEAK